jgi:hypothetical protein
VTASFDILSSNKGKNEKQSAEARIAELEDPMIGGRTDNQTLTMQEYGPILSPVLNCHARAHRASGAG